MFSLSTHALSCLLIPLPINYWKQFECIVIVNRTYTIVFIISYTVVNTPLTAKYWKNFVLHNTITCHSYMAGTNFWGTEREKEGFNAPSMDDKLVEVVGVTGFTHLATTKVLGIQNQRLAQCRYAKVVVHSEMPMQVDGEAKMQEPGVVTVTHKNKARVIIRDKVLLAQ